MKAYYPDYMQKTIVVEHDDGSIWSIPVDISNKDYVDLISSGVVIEDYVEPPITVEDIREETQKKIIALLQKKTLEETVISELNALMRSVELIDKKTSGLLLTEAEEVEEKHLKKLASSIKELRRIGKKLEVTRPPNYKELFILE